MLYARVPISRILTATKANGNIKRCFKRRGIEICASESYFREVGLVAKHIGYPYAVSLTWRKHANSREKRSAALQIVMKMYAQYGTWAPYLLPITLKLLKRELQMWSQVHWHNNIHETCSAPLKAGYLAQETRQAPHSSEPSPTLLTEVCNCHRRLFPSNAWYPPSVIAARPSLLKSAFRPLVSNL